MAKLTPETRKVVVHETKNQTPTGRRMYIDRDCPAWNILPQGKRAVEEGECAMDEALFSQIRQIVIEQDKKDHGNYSDDFH